MNTGFKITGSNKLLGRIALRWYVVVCALSLVYFFALPDRIFRVPYSTVIQDASGELLSASISADGQWRFPQTEVVPEKFIQALVVYEDKNFFNHHGIDLRSIARATKQNFEAGRIVSGGSTITMQVVRLSRQNKARTILNKVTEIILATRLEFRYTKNKILSLYAAHAPFGGNVVGIEAACWRYFAREPQHLSWAEAALLAVLPNSPSMIHPGKNRERLRAKRNALIDRLERNGIIDAVTCELSKAEDIPDAPHPLPRLAPHLLDRAAREGYEGQVARTTLTASVQSAVKKILNRHHEHLSGNQIFNAAALVMEVNSGKVIAYVGNSEAGTNGNHGNAVDIITSRRSTGSILKPFLYAAMLDEGKMLATTLVPDVPTIINGFSPRNFSRDYDGAVPADKALIRSLNVPAVHELRRYRFEKFHALLKNIGMNSLSKPADHYGLSLILGGAEGTLWDITGMYASMARTLNHYFDRPGGNRYDRNDFRGPAYMNAADSHELSNLEATSWLSAASVYQTLGVLTEVYRPGEESGWKYFDNAKKIAWKTGTSFGFRDGWAVGVTPEFVVGVWVGNADGEGRPGLTGTDAAAPLMFDIFSTLNSTKRWFSQPLMEMQQIAVCTQSGQRMGSNCIETDSLWVVKAGLQTLPCVYHKRVHTSSDGKFRVHSGCEQIEGMKEATWFVLPPAQEHYYRSKNASFAALPPFRRDCEPQSTLTTMDLIYPKPNSSIFVPRELNGTSGRAVLELAHRNPRMTVHWHLDGVYIGSTEKKHFLPCNPPAGRHVLVVVDENGETLEQQFSVLATL
ncbi:MAG: penicillin-binding protein 1C [Chryseolinea sp.]